MDRRSFLSTAGAAALAAPFATFPTFTAARAQASSGDAALNAQFERIF